VWVDGNPEQLANCLLQVDDAAPTSPTTPGALPVYRIILTAAERSELVATLRRALAALPADQAEVFMLRHVEGMSYEQVGAVMGMTGNAVGVMLNRAKGRLRELMERPIEKGEVRHG
jgi:RNA polymerase sigma factor (sigma-70 family)